MKVLVSLLLIASFISCAGVKPKRSHNYCQHNKFSHECKKQRGN